MLSAKDVERLTAAQEANPWWFDAMLEAGDIMVQRRQKYSGEQHPYYNFVDMSYREGRSLADIFRTFLNIKLSRLGVTGDQDFSDERVLDTFLDMANYALIGAGAIQSHLTPEMILPYEDWYRRLMEDRQGVQE